MNEIMMLEEEVPEADTKQGTEPSEVKDPTTGTEVGRCHFCKYMGSAGNACKRCSKVDSGSPFIYEKKIFDDTAMDPLAANMVQGQNIIVTRVTNRGGVNVHHQEPLKVELLKVEPNKGQQELPERCFKEVHGEVRLSYSPGYAEGIAEFDACEQWLLPKSAIKGPPNVPKERVRRIHRSTTGRRSPQLQC
jgi:hypothetical protein